MADLCARCLIDAAFSDGDSHAPDADEAPPCELLAIVGDTPRAVTYLGEQTWPVRRLVALKVFKLVGHGGLARPLRHPNIGQVIEQGRLGGMAYVMREYLAGGAATRWYDQHELGLGHRVQALVDLCGALAFAHGRGVPHGRVTPSNFLCDVRAPHAAKLVDFETGPAPAGEDSLEAGRRADVNGLVSLAEILLATPSGGEETVAALRGLRDARDPADALGEALRRLRALSG